MTGSIQRTPQQEFWAGSFGDDYIVRNCGAALLASNLDFPSRALPSAGQFESCVELDVKDRDDGFAHNLAFAPPLGNAR